jgi:thiamine biosynthesis lipoprotein
MNYQKIGRAILLLLALGFWSQSSATPLQQAPAFTGNSIHGEKFTFEPSKLSKPTLFVFWASWCKNCLYEMPALIALHKRAHEDLDIIGINVDQETDQARAFVGKHLLPYINIIDSQAKIADSFGVRGTPTLVLVGKNGSVLNRAKNLDKLNKTIEPILSQNDRDPAMLLHQNNPSFVERSTVLMGTDVSILIQTDQTSLALTTIEAAFAEISRIEKTMTDWREVSEVMSINHAAGKSPVKVGIELAFLLSEAIDLGELTQGGFDITYAAIGKLWNFSNPAASPPSASDLKRAKALVDLGSVVIDRKNSTVFLKHPGMRIGLGGIAKGFAVDQAVELIKKGGFKNFAVNAGGDLTVRGRNSGKLWSVAIRHPRNRQENIAILPISNGSVVTSGDSERYFTYQGKRYAHIIDPRTGYPADSCQSVTIVSKKAYQGDALATGVSVLGPEKGMALIEKTAHIEGLIVAADGSIQISSGLKK